MARFSIAALLLLAASCSALSISPVPTTRVSVAARTGAVEMFTGTSKASPKKVVKKPVAKKPVAKKPVAKKPVAKKAVAKQPVKKVVKKVVKKAPAGPSKLLGTSQPSNVLLQRSGRYNEPWNGPTPLILLDWAFEAVDLLRGLPSK